MSVDIKGHSSHDIVLLCQQCHRNASIATETLRKLLKKEDKISHQNEPLWTVDPVLKEVKSAACALRKYKDVLPEQRQIELKRTLRSYFKKEESDQITEEEIEKAAEIEFKTKNEECESHEERLVKQLKTHQDIEHFVRRWRKHFLETMKPKFMPIGWDLDHPVIYQ